MDRVAAWLYVLLLVVSVVAAAYWTHRLCEADHPQPVMPRPLPEVRQADDSLIPAVVPDPNPPAPPHKLPPKAEEGRRIEARIQPDDPKCKPLDLTVSLIDDGEAPRAVLSAEGGRVIGGADRQMAPFKQLRIRSWAAGPGYDLLNDAILGRVDYDLHPRIRLSVSAGVGDYDRDGLRREPSVAAWALIRF